MNFDSQLFFQRLMTFLKEAKISFKSTLCIFLSSVLFATIYFVVKYIIAEHKRDHLALDGKKKSHLQTGIEMFTDQILKPMWEETIDRSSIKFKRHLDACCDIHKIVNERKLYDEEGNLRPVFLVMPKRFWPAAVHVLVEVVLHEKKFIDSDEYSTDKVTRIQNALGQLYDCTRHEGNPVTISYESPFVKRSLKLVILDIYFLSIYFFIHLALGGKQMLALFLDIVAVLVLILLKRKIQSVLDSVDLRPSDILLGIPYLLIIMLLAVLLQYNGFIPVL